MENKQKNLEEEIQSLEDRLPDNLVYQSKKYAKIVDGEEPNEEQKKSHYTTLLNYNIRFAGALI